MHSPPVLRVPSPASVAARLFTVAQLVRRDIVDSADIQAQRARTGLGELLLRPFPISRLDATLAGRPALSVDLLPFVGSFSSYSNAMASTNTNSVQQRHVVTVVQASGAGKTRLAFADGAISRLVIVIHVYKQTQSFAPGWDTFLALAHHWESLLDSLASEDDRRLVSQFAMAAMRLLVGCYVSYAASVITAAVPEGQPTPLRVDDASARYRREVALRSLRNGRGDAAVGDLFLLQLAEMGEPVDMPMSSGSTARVSGLDRDAVNAFCRDSDARLRALLWPDADIAIWYDEVQSLFRTSKVFVPFDMFNRRQPAARHRRQDVFYGLVALTGNLLDEFKWLQTLCGGWLEIATQVQLPELSPMRERVTAVYHASNITVNDMLKTLRTFLILDAVCEDELRPILEDLRGRPILFFDDMLYALWTELSKQWALALGTQLSVDAASLRSILVGAAKQGVIRGRSRMTALVKLLWDPATSARINTWQSTESLCVELFAAARMNGGVFELQNDTGGEAMQRGLLALPLQGGDGSVRALAGLRVCLDDEPLSRDALVAYGDARIREATADADVVFSLLSNAMSSGAISGFSFTRSVKGEALELAFAWHVIRSVLRANVMRGTAGVRGLSLDDLLSPLAPGDFESPDCASSVFVTCQRGWSCANLAGATRLTDMHLLVTPQSQDCVIYEIEKGAGSDVTFMAVDSTLNPVSVVSMQAKARISASLRDSVRAASPAWHFLTEPERNAAIKGVRYVPGGVAGVKRSAFEVLAAGSTVFSSAFRVVLSVAGFSATVAAMCSSLNRLEEGTRSSPIILCESTAAAFGLPLHAKLKASCTGGTTNGTKELAFLLPQSAASVSAGNVTCIASTNALAEAIGVLGPLHCCQSALAAAPTATT